MKRFITLFLFMVSALQLLAQVIPGRYILELSGEPAAPYSARRGHHAHRNDSLFQSRASDIRNQQDEL